MANKTLRYGVLWDSSLDDLQIELEMIRVGGRKVLKSGNVAGEGLFQHYRNAKSCCWPEDDHTRWSDLIWKTLAENEISVILGPGDAGKSWDMGGFALIDWWAFPEQTLWMVSSTEYRGAELRIWGVIKELYNRAIDRYDWLPGRILESMHAITSEKIDDDQRKARSLKKGIIFVPVKKGANHVSLSAFVGAKSPRLRHAGDECQFFAKEFLDCYANWYGKRDFKGVLAGNPLSVDEALCTAAEPVEGWDNFIDTEKTQTWRSNWFNAAVVALDGRDTPNNDFPQDDGPRYHYLVGKKKLDAVASTHGKDSWQWFNQCVGKPKPGLVLRRVITREFCRIHGAHDVAFWQNTTRTWIYGLDPAYGGGDRCIGMPIEFGDGLEGHQILKVHPPEIVPISLNLNMPPEDQIANFVKTRLADLNIPVENCYYDSFGKGTLGFAFAQVFGQKTPRPVDFGQKPTNRPVRQDLFMEENGVRRLKRCDEHYSKYVSELWFCVREIIQGGQMRELPKSVMDEGCTREYYMVTGNKYEVEPKDDMKERMGYSPDEFDALAVCCEGARQRGFRIETIGREVSQATGQRDDWLAKEQSEYRQSLKKHLLQHV